MRHITRVYTILVDLNLPTLISIVDVRNEVILTIIEGIVTLHIVGISTRYRTTRNSISTIESHLMVTCILTLVVTYEVPVGECSTLSTFVAYKHLKTIRCTIATNV